MTEYEKALSFNQETKIALQTIYESLNQGQQQKLLKNEQVKVLLDRYTII